MMTHLRAVYFDAVGTLLYPKPSVAQAYQQIAGRWGIVLDEAEIERRFQMAFRRQDEIDRQAGLPTNETRERERWSAIVADIFHSQTLPDGLFSDLWQHFAAPENWRCFPDVADTLFQLHARELRLGIASNFDKRLRPIVAGMAELGPCSVLAISSEIGCRKPAPEFYSAMCQLTATKPEETLFVGDDWENDYEGGRSFGMRVLLLDRKASRPKGESLHNLSEMLSLL